MAYVDLNPIRAGLAAELADSAFTSIRKRLHVGEAGTAALEPICGPATAGTIGLSAAEYIELVDWSGRIARPGKRGRIAASAPATVRRLGHSGLQWKFQLLGIESRYWRAVGAADALLEKAAAMGQCWLKGQGIGRRLVRAHT